MPEDEDPVIFETAPHVPVSRAKELSNKLAKLSEGEIQFLRQHGQKPGHEAVQRLLIKAGVKQYTLKELNTALALLAGVHKLPISEKAMDASPPELLTSPDRFVPLPPARISSPRDEAPRPPSVKVAREIAEILTSLPSEDFDWLSKNLGSPKNPRSLFIIIRYHLYRYDWHDITAVIAALKSIHVRNQRVTEA